MKKDKIPVVRWLQVVRARKAKFQTRITPELIIEARDADRK